MSTPQETPTGKHHAPEAGNGRSGMPLVRLVNAGKRYGAVIALHDINMEVGPGEVTCVLGDNGAGKSTLIKIIAGLHQPSSGTYEVEGTPVHFSSPREALERGIATVYQDLAVVALMPVWRNFFLGNELRKGPRIQIGAMKRCARTNYWRWASTCATWTSPSAPCPAGSASAWRSRAPCTSAPRC